MCLRSLAGSDYPKEHVLNATLTANETIVFSVVEACNLAVLVEVQQAPYSSLSNEWFDRQVRFHDAVREVLREHRVRFDLVGPRIVDLESQELHVDVVVPVLRLLSGRPGWEGVEKAYQDALAELHNGKPEDAITDAAVALEEALAALGCQGNTLSKKMADAKAKGVLAPQDSPLADGLNRIGAWIEAERSSSGDAHNAQPASREDAWLVVHIVGTFIRRLADGPRM